MTPYFEQLLLQDGVNHLQHNPCELLDFELLVLPAGESYAFSTHEREYAAVMLVGTASFKVRGASFPRVGSRQDVFAGKPSLVYIPAGSEVSVESEVACEVALCSAPGDVNTRPYSVQPDQVVSGSWGTFNNARDYDFLIGPSTPSARLFIAEVKVSSGNWATYPPHRHEVDNLETGERFQEETYFYRVSPERGFGLAGLYGERLGGDHAFLIRHNSIQKMPAGYHTLAAAPGYRLWYLALYAGNTKSASPRLDPDHAWYQQAETVLQHRSRVI
jgi:5-deoxy-glucuronate isomerase